MHEFIKSTLSTATSTVITYPLDTLQTRQQSGEVFNCSNLYRGLESPLVTKSICDGFVFYLFNTLNYNVIISSILSPCDTKCS